MAQRLAVGGHQRAGALVEDLDERDIEHHAGREAGGDGQEPVIGALGGEGDQAADARGHAGEQRQAQRVYDVLRIHVKILHFFRRLSAVRGK
jgi:hypothetical protein